MEDKKVDKKFTWVIKNFSSLDSDEIYSDKFDIRGCKWHLSACPEGSEDDTHLSLFLHVADYETLPTGWRRHARYLLIVVNQLSYKLSVPQEIQHWFDEKSTGCGFFSMIFLKQLYAKDSGFLVNGDLRIDVELDLLEAIGKVEVNGFQLLPSQAEFASRMFEKHPKLATKFLHKDPNLRAGYMSLLLSLIDTLRQSSDGISDDVLEESRATLKSLTVAGFKLDWLEEQLDQVPEKRERVKADEMKMQETEKQLKLLEAQLEKEKEKLAASKASLSFNDVI